LDDTFLILSTGSILDVILGPVAKCIFKCLRESQVSGIHDLGKISSRAFRNSGVDMRTAPNVNSH
jgi:hypothetical protein